MPYRNPQPERLARQTNDIVDTYAGQTVTWRQYISASAGGGAAWAGISNSAYYRDSLLTAHIVNAELMEEQRPGGQVIADTLRVTLPVQPGQKDELIWRGITYRIEGDTVPARIHDRYMVTVKRGNS